jgi:hypothetical protein
MNEGRLLQQNTDWASRRGRETKPLWWLDAEVVKWKLWPEDECLLFQLRITGTGIGAGAIRVL